MAKQGDKITNARTGQTMISKPERKRMGNSWKLTLSILNRTCESPFMFIQNKKAPQ